MPVVLRSSPLLWARVAAMVFACIAFSVALYGASLTHGTGDWCVFCWSFSFVGTLLIILVEVFGLQTRAPVSWKNFPITFACYASLLCLSASIIFPLYFLKGYAGRSRMISCRIVSTVFSCLATIAYLSEKELGMTRQKYKLKIHAKEKDLLELKQAVDALKSSAQTAMENGEQIFTELMQSIERRRSKFRDLIRDQERAAESMLQTLEQEITELKQRDHELEMLLKSEDHVHVLQNCHSFSSGLPDPPFTIATLSDFGKVNDAVSALKKRLEDVFKGEWLRIYQAARSMKILHCTVPKIRSEFLHRKSVFCTNAKCY
uniref:Tripartite motif-containing protein 16-like n=1 Tax=Cyprinus carpio TaxID=7962 RepID=A0A8C2AGX3_CYPCA